MTGPLPTSNHLYRAIGLGAIGFALVMATRSAWACDDAFISFRYARNMVEGLGLVFNAGEYVEGYTNFLWTVWVALGLKLGLAATDWAHFWSLCSYAGTLMLMLGLCRRLRTDLAGAGWHVLPFPVAVLLGALHVDWRHYATSGLETSLFTFWLMLACYLAIVRKATTTVLILLGLTTGLAFLTRNDGVIPAAVIGLFVLYTAARPLRAGFVYGVSASLVAVPFLVWRLAYYGEWVPNTYYAKSAALTWHSQGAIYLALYVLRYWPLLFAFVPLLVFNRRLLGGETGLPLSVKRAVWLTWFLGLSYTYYVVRVGGDFMFARMLIPATPFFLLALELGLSCRRKQYLVGNGLFTLLLAAAFVFGKSVVDQTSPGALYTVAGIADEHSFYTDPQVVRASRRRVRVLRRYMAGLPVRMAYLGTQARVAYYARVPTVVDGYGLTDPVVARTPLPERGRVGHEKLARPEYLVSERRVHFVLGQAVYSTLALSDYVPEWPFSLRNVRCWLLHWDAVMVDALRQRGVQIEDFPAYLDDYIEQGHLKTREQLQADLVKFQHFYFDFNADPARLARLQELIGGAVR